MSHSGFWWILALGALFGVIHSTLASTRIKALAARVFGAGFARHYRLFYVTMAGITTLVYLASIILFPDKPLYRIQPPVVYLTLLLQLIAGICLVVALFQTSLLEFTGMAPLLSRPSRGEHLITNGFYRYTRHPIYLFSLIFLWLLPIMTWNLLALAIGIAVYTLSGSLLEERRLAAQFGQEYLDYKARTPWLLPIKFRRR